MVQEIKATGVGAEDDLPFSQAIIHDNTVYVSGQIGMVPETGEVIEGGIQSETEQALSNIETILDESGTSLDNIVKSTVFMNDVGEFSEFNSKYEEIMPSPYPARSAFEVSDFAIDISIEIEAIAALDC